MADGITVKSFRWKIIVTCLSGPNLITWVLKIRDSPTVVRERDVVVEDDQGDATLLTLKKEEGAMSQGMWGALRRWKRQENIFSPRVSRGDKSLLTP